MTARAQDPKLQWLWKESKGQELFHLVSDCLHCNKGRNWLSKVSNSSTVESYYVSELSQE